MRVGPALDIAGHRPLISWSETSFFDGKRLIIIDL